MVVISNKSKLRKHFKILRSNMNQQDVALKSSAIQDNFLSYYNSLIKNTNLENPIFAIYKPISNEVKTDKIENFIINDLGYVSFPLINNELDILDFYACDNDSKFYYNNIYNDLLEPISFQKVIPDIIIMPLIAFDKNLNRIGMGKGFYDKTISYLNHKISKKIVKIGLSYDLQFSSDLIDVDNFDSKLDMVISENKIWH